MRSIAQSLSANIAIRNHHQRVGWDNDLPFFFIGSRTRPWSLDWSQLLYARSQAPYTHTQRWQKCMLQKNKINKRQLFASEKLGGIAISTGPRKGREIRDGKPTWERTGVRRRGGLSRFSLYVSRAPKTLDCGNFPPFPLHTSRQDSRARQIKQQRSI